MGPPSPDVEATPGGSAGRADGLGHVKVQVPADTQVVAQRGWSGR